MGRGRYVYKDQLFLGFGEEDGRERERIFSGRGMGILRGRERGG